MKRVESLRGPWLSLLGIFREADHLPEDHLALKIAKLSLEQTLKEGLLQAIHGDNRPLNTWLFSENSMSKDLIAWIAPVAVDGVRRHAWMIGKRSELTPEVERRFIAARKNTATDNLLLQQDIPLPLLFMRPIAVSVFDGRSSSMDNEFAIFQTSNSATTAEMEDFDQRMVANCDYLILSRQQALNRAQQVIRIPESIDRIKASLSLFALIHNEGHNQGHFMGPWPYHHNKACVLGEALEEFRACLIAIRLAEHLGLSNREMDDFVMSVFMIRFFGSGFDAFCLERQQRDTAREISVGLMFFETLRAHKVIRVSNGKITIPSFAQVRHCLVDTLKEIHDAEYSARKGGIESLRALATHWYTVAFPDRTYSPTVLEMYHQIKN